MPQIDSNRRPAVILLASLVFALGIFFSYAYAYSFRIDGDILQMLNAGQHYLQTGEFLAYGNSTSGGLGKVPGSLTAIVSGLPLKLWNSPYSILLFLTASHLAALVLLFLALRSQMTPHLLLGLLLFYWLNPWRVSQIFIWNPSYLFFCSALHLYSGLRMLEKKSSLATFMHVLSIGIAFQFHTSSFLLFLMSLWLFYRRRLHIHWPAAVSAGALCGLSLLPYVFYLMGEPVATAKMADTNAFFGKGLVTVYPLLKSTLYWFRFSSFAFPKSLQQLVEFSWLGAGSTANSAQIIWNLLVWPMAGISFLWSLKQQWQYWQRKNWREYWLKKKNLSFSSWDEWVVAGFLSVLVATALSPSELLYWHLVIIYPVAIYVPLVKFCDIGEHNPQRFLRLFGLVLGYFVLVNGAAVLGSEKHSWQENPQQAYEQLYPPSR